MINVNILWYETNEYRKEKMDVEILVKRFIHTKERAQELLKYGRIDIEDGVLYINSNNYAYRNLIKRALDLDIK